jgi:signal transduction histidine kinase
MKKSFLWGGLAAGMAHEINNPLAGVTQTAEVLTNRLTKIDMPANKKSAEQVGIQMEQIFAFMEKRNVPHMLEIIRTSGQRVSDIINNMLSFSRKSQLVFDAHRIEELIETVLEMAGSDFSHKTGYDFRKIKIEKSYEKNVPAIACDDVKIQQVLLNILRNSAQAMQRVTNKTPIIRICLSSRPDTGMICLSIKDNGPGMDKATTKKIFEPFFSTKPKGEGTGLGLSVSYFIITQIHGGTIDVQSEKGRGTCFEICLPIQQLSSSDNRRD